MNMKRIWRISLFSGLTIKGNVWAKEPPPGSSSDRPVHLKNCESPEINREYLPSAEIGDAIILE